MVSVNSDERRKYTRVGFTTAIHILLDIDGKQIDFEGNSKDLSLRGIFVNTDIKFPAQTKCSVTIFLAGGVDKIELLIDATVVRETENGMGIEFDSMDLDTYSHLKNIVYYNSVDETA
ncbi:MAG: PilZ domain-containing protein [Pseudomonadota bacterium]